MTHNNLDLKNRLKHGSLFSGIGGFDLAAERVGWSNEFHCEIKPFCLQVLKAHFPNSITYEDITTTDFSQWKNRIDIITGGVPCFTENTLVATKRGYVKINEVSLEDSVLTHTGNYKKVLSLMKREANEIYSVRAQGLPDALETTAEHPFYVRSQYHKFNRERRSYDRFFTDPYFVEAKNLKRGDYVGYVLDTPNDNDSHSIEFWYMVGRYLGDGWTNNSKRKPDKNKPNSRKNSYNHRVIICTSNDDADNLEKYIVNAGYSSAKVVERTCTKFHITNQELYEFMIQFGMYAHGKHLTQLVFELSNEKQKAVFDGWQDADGYEKDGLTSVTTVSRQLALDMTRVARNVYKVPVSLGTAKPKRICIIEGRTVNERRQYHLRLHKNSKRYGFYENGYVWCLFKKITVVSKNETVYNLEIEDDNTYTANGLAVHNCQPFSKAGKMLGKEDKRYLWDDYIRVIRECKPRWFVAENVSGLLTTDDGNAYEQIMLQLETEGYETLTIGLPACAVGAYHIRERVWIIGRAKVELNSDTTGRQLGEVPDKSQEEGTQHSTQLSGDPFGLHWYEAISRIHGVFNGISRKLDAGRNTALGNAIVPQVAQVIFETINKIDML